MTAELAGELEPRQLPAAPQTSPQTSGTCLKPFLEKPLPSCSSPLSLNCSPQQLGGLTTLASPLGQQVFCLAPQPNALHLAFLPFSQACLSL